MAEHIFWTISCLSKTEELPVSGEGEFFPLVVMLGILKETDIILHWASVFVATVVEMELEDIFKEIFTENKESENFVMTLFLMLEIKLHKPGYTFKLDVRELKRVFAFNKLISK